jgi:hypothetical protein
MTKKNFLWVVLGSFVTVFSFTVGLQLALVEDVAAYECFCCVEYCPAPCDDAIQLIGGRHHVTDPCAGPVLCGPAANPPGPCPGPFYGLTRNCPEPESCE